MEYDKKIKALQRRLYLINQKLMEIPRIDISGIINLTYTVNNSEIAGLLSPLTQAEFTVPNAELDSWYHTNSYDQFASYQLHIIGNQYCKRRVSSIVRGHHNVILIKKAALTSLPIHLPTGVNHPTTVGICRSNQKNDLKEYAHIQARIIEELNELDR